MNTQTIPKNITNSNIYQVRNMIYATFKDKSNKKEILNKSISNIENNINKIEQQYNYINNDLFNELYSYLDKKDCKVYKSKNCSFNVMKKYKNMNYGLDYYTKLVKLVKKELDLTYNDNTFNQFYETNTDMIKYNYDDFIYKTSIGNNGSIWSLTDSIVLNFTENINKDNRTRLDIYRQISLISSYFIAKLTLNLLKREFNSLL